MISFHPDKNDNVNSTINYTAKNYGVAFLKITVLLYKYPHAE